MSDADFILLFRVVGVSHVVLGLAHFPLWRLLGWSEEMMRVSPLTARVFAVHTFFVGFLLVALGSLASCRADLLVAPSDFARLVLGFGAVFWALRLACQPLVFDPVLALGSRFRTPLRVAAVAGFGCYTAAYAWGLAHQLGI